MFECADDLGAIEGRGILTLAWNLVRGSNTRSLISATIELLPSTVEMPTFDPERASTEVGKRHFLFMRRFNVSVEMALEWYNECRRGTVRLPEVEGNDLSQRELFGPKTLSEPPWPGLQCSAETKIPGVVVAASPCRACSLLPSDPSWIDDLWDDDERREAADWLRNRLDFDFSVDPEYVGAAHLVALEGDLVELGVARVGEVRDGFAIHISPTFCGEGSGYSFILRRRRPRGWETSLMEPLEGAFCLRLAHDPFECFYEVVHERRGIVMAEGPFVFLDGASFDVGLVTRERKVQVAAKGKRGPDEYRVPFVRDSMRVESGAPGPRNASQILASNYARRENRRPPYQDWFDGSDIERATRVVRTLITRARRSILVVDPYFDHTEYARFVLALSHPHASVRILTSAEGLRQRAKREQRKPGRSLADVVAKTEAEILLSPDIHVMGGARPEVHDRFLVVDEHVWLLGSSLEEFGMRGTALVALPDPKAVMRHLENAWKAAPRFEDWMSARADT